MAISHLIDGHKFRRNVHYWPMWCLRRLPLGHIIYDQTVSSLQAQHVQIPTLYNGNAAHGRLIQSDQFPLSNDTTVGLLRFWTTRCKYPEAYMRRSGLSVQEIHWLNRFDWLASLVALSQENIEQKNNSNELNFIESTSPDTKKFCVDIVQNWIRSHSHWSGVSWHIPTLARRINNWLYFYATFFGESTNSAFDGIFFLSISKQLHHLRISVMQETQGFDRIISLICWVNSSLCLSNEDKHLTEGVTLLSIELYNAFHTPHSELLSSPHLAHEVHNHLVHVCKGFSREKISVPPEFEAAILRLEQLLLLYRTPNSTLARFHGTWDLPAKSIKIPRRTHKHVSIPPFAKPSLLRLSLDGFDLTLDATSSPPNRTGAYQHLSPLAMEIYDGQQPIVINASPPADHTLLTQQEYRDNTFHSMPLLESPNLGSIRPDGTFGRNPYCTKQTPTSNLQNSSNTIICSHDGYQKKLGAQLERRIEVGYNDKQKLLIYGCDTLEFNNEPRTDDPLRMISMFHLHPDLETQQLAGGGMLVFKKKRTEAWQFDPVNAGSSLHVIQTLTSYRNGVEPVLLNTLWMACEITQPQQFNQYRNEWTLCRVNK